MTSRDAATVVPMTLEDIPRVLEIDQLSFPLPWSATSYRYELTQNPNSHFWVAVTGGAVRPEAAETKASGGLDWLAPSRWFRPPAPPPPARSVRCIRIGAAGAWARA